jgi:hypothetical protein
VGFTGTMRQGGPRISLRPEVDAMTCGGMRGTGVLHDFNHRVRSSRL